MRVRPEESGAERNERPTSARVVANRSNDLSCMHRKRSAKVEDSESRQDADDVEHKPRILLVRAHPKLQLQPIVSADPAKLDPNPTHPTPSPRHLQLRPSPSDNLQILERQARLDLRKMERHHRRSVHRALAQRRRELVRPVRESIERVLHPGRCDRERFVEVAGALRGTSSATIAR